jgi:hypothetical protein
MSITKKKRRSNNYAGRFTAILFIAMFLNLLLYKLPGSIMGIKIKKVDLLSDIRVQPDKDKANDVAVNGSDINFVQSDEAVPDEDVSEKADDKAALQALSTSDRNPAVTIPDATLQPPIPQGVKREQSATSQSKTEESDADIPPKPKVESKAENDFVSNNSTDIEDFTTGQTGLRRFFAALNNVDNLGRPVRIAFLGDSFIEGDILVADFRSKMQKHFGGRGVGFIPIQSETAQYRPTIKQSADGWKIYSMIKDKSRKYVLSGMLFEPSANTASINFQTVDMYPESKEVSSLKFIYSSSLMTDITLKNGNESSTYKLPATDQVTQYEIKGRFTNGKLQFKNTRGLQAIGIALEDNHGVVVDNFSLRGNSGLIMSNLDVKSCRDLQKVRPYDLIVLQYGLNVASDSMRDYGWYRNKMTTVVEHIQKCFPGADILMLGVSDRSHKDGATYSTMPAVLSLLRAQRQTAKNAEVAFWSIFAAMGGHNSMVKFVNSNLASKDYTHLNFRGGRQIADALYDSLINEKGMYDSDEKLVER